MRRSFRKLGAALLRTAANVLDSSPSGAIRQQSAAGDSELVSFRRPGGTAAVLFIHGFGGDARQTWGDFPWLLVADRRLNGWDVFSFGYPTGLRVDVPGLWAADPGLNHLALALKTALTTPPLSTYESIALVAHSMGGLVAQKALLDEAVKKRTGHLCLFGTPSLGLQKANIVSKLKEQIFDMSLGSAFLVELRRQWDEKYGRECSFELRVIAGERDEFVPVSSALDPFPTEVQAVVPGNHIEIVKPTSSEHRGVRLLTNLLLGRTEAMGLYDSAVLAVERCQYRDVIDKLQPRVSQLDDDAVVQLALALDAVGRGPEALELLENRYRQGINATDAMGVLAGRLKRRWLAERRDDDWSRAKALYCEALALAQGAGDDAQVYYHAINVAFLDLMRTPPESDVPETVIAMAEIALRCSARSGEHFWRYATVGEACLMLNRLPDASSAYSTALCLRPSTREVDSMYSQASRVATRVLGDAGLRQIDLVFGVRS